MTPEDIKQAYLGLHYEQDNRNPPDERRRGHFRTGWEDATNRGKVYTVGTLSGLTWHNLGYRLGKHFGEKTSEEVDSAYDFLAAIYRSPHVDDLVMPQYWIVGAMWGGHDDHFEEFIRRGYWLLGWSDEEKPVMAARSDRIKPGDLLAIKKRISPLTHIEIRAIGTVTENDLEDHQVYVRWLASDLHRRVPSKGCYDSIRGPFDPHDEWTRDVFQLEHSERPVGGGNWSDVDEELPLATEGAKRWRWHLQIERNRTNVKRKKAQAKRETGSLECEVCTFNFAEVYGALGSDFCEVHHRKLLSQLDPAVRPKLCDLAIICANCHRMIHRTKPLMTIDEFREQLMRLFGA